MLRSKPPVEVGFLPRDGAPHLADRYQRRGVDTSAPGALPRKGDEWRGPFATESHREDHTP
jgi:hypothetical protein